MSSKDPETKEFRTQTQTSKYIFLSSQAIKKYNFIFFLQKKILIQNSTDIRRPKL